MFPPVVVEKKPNCVFVGFVVGVPNVILLFPDIENPPLAVSNPADVIVPVVVVEILPDVEILPEVEIAPAPEIVSPVGNTIPLFAVSVPSTVNAPFIVVPDVLLPIVVAPAPTPVLVLIFTNWVDIVVPV